MARSRCRWAAPARVALPSLCLILALFLSPRAALASHLLEKKHHRRCAIYPGDPAPYLSVETLNGTFTYDPDSPRNAPLVIYAFDPRDGMSEAMFSMVDSVDRFLKLDSSPSHFLFLCHCENDTQATLVARGMRGALEAGIEALGAEEVSAAAWDERLHFGVQSVADVPTGWLPDLFREWNATVARLEANVTAVDAGTFSMKRLDGHFGWLPHAPASDEVFAGKLVENICNASAPASSSAEHWRIRASGDGGEAFVVPWSPDSQCSFATILQKAESMGAAVAILYPKDPGQTLTEITCFGDECNVAISIPATMVSGQEAQRVARALERNETVTFKFTSEDSDGRAAAIDTRGSLQESGWQVWPWLASLGWTAQYLNFEQGVQSRLDAAGRGNGGDGGNGAGATMAPTATTIEVFDGSEALDGDLTTSVRLAPEVVSALHESTTALALEMELGCSGHFDYECPEWDHVVQLFVCCGDPEQCQACPQLIWAEPPRDLQRGGDGSGRERVYNASNPGGDLKCGPEIGRWMTPFRRRVGRWLTDVSVMKGALVQNLTADGDPTCDFRMRSVTWAATGDHYWYPKLALHLRARAEPKGRGSAISTEPTVISLFDSKTFDSHFNDDRLPFIFRTPEKLVSAHIRALITGHGSDNNGCAEFCAGITNHFVVNGQEFLLDFPLAGTQLGCTEQVVNGSEPNEHGTWFFGRNGWCDGQDVPPWTIDISTLLKAPGDVNIVEYAGLYQGDTPNPTENPGQILMSSYLVLESFSDTR